MQRFCAATPVLKQPLEHKTSICAAPGSGCFGLLPHLVHIAKEIREIGRYWQPRWHSRRRPLATSKAHRCKDIAVDNLSCGVWCDCDEASPMGKYIARKESWHTQYQSMVPALSDTCDIPLVSPKRRLSATVATGV